MDLRAQGQALHALSNMDSRIMQQLFANEPSLKGVNLMDMLDGLMQMQKGLVQQQQQHQQQVCDICIKSFLPLSYKCRIQLVFLVELYIY